MSRSPRGTLTSSGTGKPGCLSSSSFDWNLLMAVSDRIRDHRLVGGLLTVSSDYGFVLEDDEGICGYALGTVDVKPFIKKCKMSWIPFMQEKYHKPDCEKDLSDAEVWPQYIFISIVHPRSSWYSPYDLLLLSVEDDTELSWGGGGSTRLVLVQFSISHQGGHSRQSHWPQCGQKHDGMPVIFSQGQW